MAYTQFLWAIAGYDLDLLGKICERNLYNQLEDHISDLNADILSMMVVNELETEYEYHKSLKGTNTNIEIIDVKQVMGLYISRHKNYHDDAIEYYKGIG